MANHLESEDKPRTTDESENADRKNEEEVGQPVQLPDDAAQENQPKPQPVK